MRAALWMGLAAIVLVACGRHPVPPPGSLPCEVDDVLGRGCRQCHDTTPAFGAPMPLASQADLQAPARSDASKKAYQLVGQRIHDTARPMPPPPNAPLSAADLAVLDNWIGAGAPAGTDASCSSDGGTPAPPSTIGPMTCTPDMHIAPQSPWAMPQTTLNEYVCYGFDVTPAQKRQVIGMAAHIDNKTIVHHMLLFESSTAESGTPAPCLANNSIQWRLIYAWAPGANPIQMPPEAGFPVEGTTHYVVQVHYDNANQLAGQTDSSGFDLCSTDQLRPNDADVVAFGSMSFTIPAGGLLDISCDYTLPSGMGPLHTLGAFPHMHRLGTQISTAQLPGGTGPRVDLGTETAWNFELQPWLPVNATLQGGDGLRTRCAWNNPGVTPVSFGEKTSDEMCFSFTVYYPKIVGGFWSWMLPAYRSTCVATP